MAGKLLCGQRPPLGTLAAAQLIGWLCGRGIPASIRLTPPEGSTSRTMSWQGLPSERGMFKTLAKQSKLRIGHWAPALN